MMIKLNVSIWIFTIHLAIHRGIKGEIVRSTYWFETAWVDLSYPPTDFLFNVSAVSPMPCLITCAASSQCLGMYFDIVTTRCYGITNIHSQGTIRIGDNCRYFMKDPCSHRENSCFMHRYQLFRIHMNHASALHYCRERGGYLVRTETVEEMKYITDLVNKQIGNWEYWTDVTDSDIEGDYRYSNGQKVTATFWLQNEPTLQFASSNDCIKTICSRSNCGWDDAFCGKTHPFICEFEV